MRRDIGLGTVDFQSRRGGKTLEEARTATHEARKLARQGVDPIAEREKEREAERLKEASTITFKDAAEQYIKLQAPDWKNRKSETSWRRSFELHIYPVW
jgi:phage terminase small subunit